MKMISNESSFGEVVFKDKYSLEDGTETFVQAVRYPRDKVTPNIVVFDRPTRLIDWCKENDVTDAVNGGFTQFHRSKRPTRLLGKHVLNGSQLDHIPFSTPRSGIHVDISGSISIVPKDQEVDVSRGSFLQAGPMLVKDGIILADESYDYEGVARPPLQMDDDWTRGRFPRTALGICRDNVYTITCNGYSPHHEYGDKGLTLQELANIMLDLGIESALNLDGGSKSTHIVGGNIINKPRGGERDDFQIFPNGLPIMSAIYFKMRK